MSNIAKSLFENKLELLAASDFSYSYFDNACRRIAAHIISGSAYV